MNFDVNIIQTHAVPHSEEITALSTKYVIHFTNYEGLLGILKNGFRPSFIEEEVIATKIPNNEKQFQDVLENPILETEKIKIPMVCFCDIPDKDIANHKNRYGNYGIALSKEWAFTKGINPLVYLKVGTHLSNIIASMDNAIIEFKEIDKGHEFYKVMEKELLNLRSFFKSYQGPDDKIPGKNFKFYDEREWRYVAKGFRCEDYWDPSKYLKLETSDIVKIIVTTEKEKAEIHKLYYMPNQKINVAKIGNHCSLLQVICWLKRYCQS